MRKFPNNPKFSWESKKWETWNTSVQRSASGRVRTMTNQLLPQWTIEATYPALSDEEARGLLGFYALVKGAHEPFLWLDPEDHEEKGAPLLSVAPGKYQAVMRIGEYTEATEYIENVTVYADGKVVAPSFYTVTNGVIIFREAPPAASLLTADYTYYWKVMFKSDSFTVEKLFANINKASFTLVSAR